MTARRLEKGGRIDRQKRLDFTWDDRCLQGLCG